MTRTAVIRAKSGKRADLGGLYVRSAYEANYCRWLNLLIAKGQIKRWEYEPDEFEFPGIKRGVRFYKPDFKVWLPSDAIEYHEVKGWDYPEGRTARKRMAKYYPEITIVLVGPEFFRALKAQHVQSLIEHWE